MLARTDHKAAPWVLVEADDKRWARVKVVESVVAAIEAGHGRTAHPGPAAPASAARPTTGAPHWVACGLWDLRSSVPPGTS